ncbi:formin-like protein 6 isoform X2 [Durio zibethinus]|uniref:Formin-like protein n=1 Tax=Durio zibethinus TaxID=66656 RepID=A0A6P5XNN5_DURZI|nr:formin-like protein 6 isoform X2 [Durio zibethinus]
MALFRKFFYRKPPDGLLEISERVYVFDCCFSTDVWEDKEYKIYIGGIVGQLRDHLPDASFMVFNFREGEYQSQIASILSEYDMTVMDYPRQYEGCPLLNLEVIHHFLRSSESWLLLGQQNVILMHSELGGWPVVAFMLAALLIYRKQFTGEQKTLEMIYKQAPRELLHLMSPLNPLPSQLRYLQYVSRRNAGSEWPPSDRALTLDCIILRFIPNMDGEGGCRPVFRIYGQDPLMAADRTPKVLFSTPKKTKLVRYYKQVDCELVKIDIHCHVLGDVVLECISLHSDQERESMMFRVMFNTAFIRSNILMLNREEIDILWNAMDQFPKDFRVEVYNGDKENLGKCEQFFLELIKVPRVESKLRVFLFKIQFCSQVLDLRNSLNTVNSAAEEVRNSVKLKRIMQTILSLGNALNHGTARGSAIGFRLDSLLKLTDTRARNNKMTLMHYLCKVLVSKLPELLDFPKDLVTLEASTKIQLKCLAEEMQAISKGLEKVVQELTASENDGPVSETFCRTLKEFLSFAEGEVRSLASLYSSVGRNADALALYFGEDPARCPFEQVVSTLLNFVRMFVRAHEENCKQLELEKKKAQKEAENEKLKVSTLTKESDHMIQSPNKSANIQ